MQIASLRLYQGFLTMDEAIAQVENALENSYQPVKRDTVIQFQTVDEPVATTSSVQPTATVDEPVVIQLQTVSTTSSATGLVQTVNETLHYLQAVAQRGRPAKRKQQLSDSVNNLVIFDRQRPHQRDQLRLSWIMGQEIASKALKTIYLIKPGNLQSSAEALLLCVDEHSMVNKIRQYLEQQAWVKLQSIIQALNVEDVTCPMCRSIPCQRGKVK